MIEFVCLWIVVAVMVDDRYRPARAGDAGHLGGGRADVAEVVRCQTRTHEVELARGERYIFRRGLAGLNYDTLRCGKLSRGGEHVWRRVDQDNPPGAPGERKSEVPGTAADIADSVNRSPRQE